MSNNNDEHDNEVGPTLPAETSVDTAKPTSEKKVLEYQYRP
jgi:hypothetical protein